MAHPEIKKASITFREKDGDLLARWVSKEQGRDPKSILPSALTSAWTHNAAQGRDSKKKKKQQTRLL
jgi:hypothetical protein